MVLTGELRSVVTMARRDVTYDIGSFITLIDGPNFDFIWRERKDLLIEQIRDADLVMLSRSDLLGEARVAEVKRVLGSLITDLNLLSTRKSIGVDHVFKHFL